MIEKLKDTCFYKSVITKLNEKYELDKSKDENFDYNVWSQHNLLWNKNIFSFDYEYLYEKNMLCNTTDKMLECLGEDATDADVINYVLLNWLKTAVSNEYFMKCVIDLINGEEIYNLFWDDLSLHEHLIEYIIDDWEQTKFKN